MCCKKTEFSRSFWLFLTTFSLECSFAKPLAFLIIMNTFNPNQSSTNHAQSISGKKKALVSYEIETLHLWRPLEAKCTTILQNAYQKFGYNSSKKTLWQPTGCILTTLNIYLCCKEWRVMTTGGVAVSELKILSGEKKYNKSKQFLQYQDTDTWKETCISDGFNYPCKGREFVSHLNTT